MTATNGTGRAKGLGSDRRDRERTHSAKELREMDVRGYAVLYPIASLISRRCANIHPGGGETH